MSHDPLCGTRMYVDSDACCGEGSRLRLIRASERQRCIALLVDEIDSIYGRLPSVDGALLEGLRWAVEYLHDTREPPSA